jgi:flagellar biosynthesis protein FlhF
VRLKSYFCSSVEEALKQARLELGPDAMLVQTRKAPPEARHLGECEVVFALEQATAPAAGPEPPVEVPAIEAPGGFNRLSTEMAEMRRQIERISNVVARSSLMGLSQQHLQPELSDAFASLVAAEVEPELAHDIVQQIRSATLSPDPYGIRSALDREIAKRVRVNATLGGGGEGPRIVALIGPAGSGKTTTLAKLATRYGLTTRKPTQLISMDTWRIAGAEQLRSFAAILGLGFQALETVGGLTQALEEHRNKSLILIDTPGLSLKDLDYGADLVKFFASHPEIDTHLCLTASMKSADLSRVVDRFEAFRPGKLLFTKLDETETFGPLLTEAVRTGKPISFLTAGQQVPEDLEAATVERITGLVLRDEPSPAAIETAA